MRTAGTGQVVCASDKKRAWGWGWSGTSPCQQKKLKRTFGCRSKISVDNRMVNGYALGGVGRLQGQAFRNRIGGGGFFMGYEQDSGRKISNG